MPRNWKLSLNILLTSFLCLVAVNISCAHTPIPSGSILSDKVVHALAFAATLVPTAVLAPRYLLFTVGFVVCLIAGIEFFVRDHRCPSEYLSWAAELMGVTFAFCTITIVQGICHAIDDESDDELPST
jgi:hypothetical protein